MGPTKARTLLDSGQPSNSTQSDPIVSENQYQPTEFRSITLDKPRRQVGRPIRYGFDDVVAMHCKLLKKWNSLSRLLTKKQSQRRRLMCG